MKKGEVLTVGRRNAPSLHEKTWLAKKNRGVTIEIHIQKSSGQRHFMTH